VDNVVLQVALDVTVLGVVTGSETFTPV
jgi:hypothetical protein